MLEGRDTLGLLPTGGGKSICFQVPALAIDGLTIVVTPLISLMKDQVDNLRSVGISAVFVHAGLSRREAELAYDRCRLGKAKLLYVSPERVRTDRFLTEARLWNISIIVVDEAHCISQWGYDFRPSYLEIARLRLLSPDTPILALTASATPDVVEDIRQRLCFRPGNRMFAKSFARDNISFLTRHNADKIGMLMKILSNTTGSAIVYVRSRRKTAEIAGTLKDFGLSAEFYHAGLTVQEKNDRQNRWKSGDSRIIVATNAFGMGIDKPDVRTVVHYDLPSSLEEYYQEAGRAGRDGKPSFAVILTSRTDKAILSRRLAEAFPPRDFITGVYDKLCVYLGVAVGAGYECVFPFDTDAFCQRYGIEPARTRSALNLLSQSGYIEYTEDAAMGARATLICNKQELYDLDVSPEADRVLQTMLREYTGLFADYVYIDEISIARNALVATDDVYPALLELQRAKALHYIPRSSMPFVRFVTSREDSRHLCIPRSIYEDRRARLEARIEAMKAFAFDSSSCRVKRMLGYFGQQSGDCGKCDYCREHKRTLGSENDNDATDRINKFLSCNEVWNIRDISSSTGVSGRQLDDILQHLTDEGRITVVSADGLSYRTLC